MEFADPNSPPPYSLIQVIPSLGLAAIGRDHEALHLDFLLDRPDHAVRIAMTFEDAQRMQHALQSLLDLVTALGARSAIDLN